MEAPVTLSGSAGRKIPAGALNEAVRAGNYYTCITEKLTFCKYPTETGMRLAVRLPSPAACFRVFVLSSGRSEPSLNQQHLISDVLICVVWSPPLRPRCALNANTNTTTDVLFVKLCPANDHTDRQTDRQREKVDI